MHTTNFVSYGIVLSGGGMCTAYATGAIRALTEMHGVQPRVVVALSGGGANAAFALARRYDDMYRWAQLLDDSRFISWSRLWNGPIMDVDFLVDNIFRVQAPTLEDELARTGANFFLGVTRFPDGTTCWLQEGSLYERLRAAKMMPGVSNHGVVINGIHYADGCLSTTVEDCVEKAFAEGAEHVIVIDTSGNGCLSAVAKTILRFGSRNFAPYVQTAVARFCGLTSVPIPTQPRVTVCRPQQLPTRHQLDRDAKRSAASIELGHTDASQLRLP